jgi:hypothetical protein
MEETSEMKVSFKGGLGMRTAIAIVVAVATIASVSAIRVSAADCLRMTVAAEGATVMWNKVDEGKASAVAAWEDEARRRAGAEYASWSRAQSKNVSCNLVTKGTSRCKAAGTPCK